MAGQLGDDGTMDTVIYCDECGMESRYNYDGGDDSTLDERVDAYMEDHKVTRSAAIDAVGEADYDAFVSGCIEDFNDEHECTEPRDAADEGEL